MNKKIDIYCEFGFLEKFYSSWPQSNERNTEKNISYWRDFDELLCKHSSVVLMGIDDQTLVEQSENNENTLLRESLLDFMRIWSEGDLRCTPIKCTNKDFVSRDKLQTLFFLDTSLEECNKLSDDYGLIFISNDNFTNWAKFLFSSDIILVDESKKNWNFVQQYKHPCNTIILVDNYILEKDDAVLKQNIKTLFDALLPIQLKQSAFNIHIITKNVNNSEGENKKSIIRDTIHNLKRPYDLKFWFPSYIRRGDLHDRYLITNYCMFNSGYGFALSDSERQTGTSLMVWPLTYLSKYGNNESRNNVYKIIQNLRKKN